MIAFFYSSNRKRFQFIKFFVVWGVIFAFCGMSLSPFGVGTAQAQVQPSAVSPQPSVISQPLIKGLRLIPAKPFEFEFIVEAVTGNEERGTGTNDGVRYPLPVTRYQDEVLRLIKYFLASLTVPDDDIWVNLNPNEPDRIIPKVFGQTDMGRDLLAQDYVLKQLSASLLSPENEHGKKFWEKIYESLYASGISHLASGENLNANNQMLNAIQTFSRVWIVPGDIEVFENGDRVFITKAELKVMMEEDYWVTGNGERVTGTKDDVRHPLHVTRYQDDVKQTIRGIILPLIQEEVNNGESFAPLRQIYHSLILASWYKRKLKDSILTRIYGDQKRIEGIELEDKQQAQRIYDQYLESFRNGVNNIIREEYDPATQTVIPRQYFTGGASLALQQQTFRQSTQLSKFDAASLNVVRAGLQSFSSSKVDDAMMNENISGFTAEQSGMIRQTWGRARDLSGGEADRIETALKGSWGEDRLTGTEDFTQPFFLNVNEPHFRKEYFLDKERKDYAFVRIGNIFLMDPGHYFELDEQARILLGTNVILLRSLKSSMIDLTKRWEKVYTTAMLMLMQQDKDHESFIGLDLGSGDGILSLMAHKLGSSYSVMADNVQHRKHETVMQMSLNGYQEDLDYKFFKADISNEQQMKPVMEEIQRVSGITRKKIVVYSNIGYWPNLYSVNNGDSIGLLRNIFGIGRIYLGGYTTGTFMLGASEEKDSGGARDLRLLSEQGFRFDKDIRFGNFLFTVAFSANSTNPAMMNQRDSDMDVVSDIVEIMLKVKKIKLDKDRHQKLIDAAVEIIQAQKSFSRVRFSGTPAEAFVTSKSLQSTQSDLFRLSRVWLTDDGEVIVNGNDDKGLSFVIKDASYRILMDIRIGTNPNYPGYAVLNVVNQYDDNLETFFRAQGLARVRDDDALVRYAVSVLRRYWMKRVLAPWLMDKGFTHMRIADVRDESVDFFKQELGFEVSLNDIGRREGEIALSRLAGDQAMMTADLENQDLNILIDARYKRTKDTNLLEHREQMVQALQAMLRKSYQNIPHYRFITQQKTSRKKDDFSVSLGRGEINKLTPIWLEEDGTVVLETNQAHDLSIKIKNAQNEAIFEINLNTYETVDEHQNVAVLGGLNSNLRDAENNFLSLKFHEELKDVPEYLVGHLMALLKVYWIREILADILTSRKFEVLSVDAYASSARGYFMDELGFEEWPVEKTHPKDEFVDRLKVDLNKIRLSSANPAMLNQNDLVGRISALLPPVSLVSAEELYEKFGAYWKDVQAWELAFAIIGDELLNRGRWLLMQSALSRGAPVEALADLLQYQNKEFLFEEYFPEESQDMLIDFFVRQDGLDRETLDLFWMSVVEIYAARLELNDFGVTMFPYHNLRAVSVLRWIEDFFMGFIDFKNDYLSRISPFHVRVEYMQRPDFVDLLRLINRNPSFSVKSLVRYWKQVDSFRNAIYQGMSVRSFPEGSPDREIIIDQNLRVIDALNHIGLKTRVFNLYLRVGDPSYDSIRQLILEKSSFVSGELERSQDLLISTIKYVVSDDLSRANILLNQSWIGPDGRFNSAAKEILSRLEEKNLVFFLKEMAERGIKMVTFSSPERDFYDTDLLMRRSVVLRLNRAYQNNGFVLQRNGKKLEWVKDLSSVNDAMMNEESKDLSDLREILEKYGNDPKNVEKFLLWLSESDKELTLEVGAGRAKSTLALAQANPHVRFVAIDSYEDYHDFRREFFTRNLDAQRVDLDNLIVLKMNFEDLERLPEASLDNIFMLRPDRELIPLIGLFESNGNMERILKSDGHIRIIPHPADFDQFYKYILFKQRSFHLSESVWKNIKLSDLSDFHPSRLTGYEHRNYHIFGDMMWTRSKSDSADHPEISFKDFLKTRSMEFVIENDLAVRMREAFGILANRWTLDDIWLKEEADGRFSRISAEQAVDQKDVYHLEFIDTDVHDEAHPQMAWQVYSDNDKFMGTVVMGVERLWDGGVAEDEIRFIRPRSVQMENDLKDLGWGLLESLKGYFPSGLLSVVKDHRMPSETLPERLVANDEDQELFSDWNMSAHRVNMLNAQSPLRQKVLDFLNGQADAEVLSRTFSQDAVTTIDKDVIAFQDNTGQVGGVVIGAPLENYFAYLPELVTGRILAEEGMWGLHNTFLIEDMIFEEDHAHYWWNQPNPVEVILQSLLLGKIHRQGRGFGYVSFFKRRDILESVARSYGARKVSDVSGGYYRLSTQAQQAFNPLFEKDIDDAMMASDEQWRKNLSNLGNDAKDIEKFLAWIQDRTIPLVFEAGAYDGRLAEAMARQNPGRRVVAFDLYPDQGHVPDQYLEALRAWRERRLSAQNSGLDNLIVMRFPVAWLEFLPDDAVETLVTLKPDQELMKSLGWLLQKGQLDRVLKQDGEFLIKPFVEFEDDLQNAYHHLFNGEPFYAEVYPRWLGVEVEQFSSYYPRVEVGGLSLGGSFIHVFSGVHWVYRNEKSKTVKDMTIFEYLDGRMKAERSFNDIKEWQKGLRIFLEQKQLDDFDIRIGDQSFHLQLKEMDGDSVIWSVSEKSHPADIIGTVRFSTLNQLFDGFKDVLFGFMPLETDIDETVIQAGTLQKAVMDRIGERMFASDRAMMSLGEYHELLQEVAGYVGGGYEAEDLDGYSVEFLNELLGMPVSQALQELSERLEQTFMGDVETLIEAQEVLPPGFVPGDFGDPLQWKRMLRRASDQAMLGEDAVRKIRSNPVIPVEIYRENDFSVEYVAARSLSRKIQSEIRQIIKRNIKGISYVNRKFFTWRLYHPSTIVLLLKRGGQMVGLIAGADLENYSSAIARDYLDMPRDRNLFMKNTFYVSMALVQSDAQGQAYFKAGYSLLLSLLQDPLLRGKRYEYLSYHTHNDFLQKNAEDLGHKFVYYDYDSGKYFRVDLLKNAAMMDVSSLDFDWENLKVLLEKDNDPVDVEKFLSWLRESAEHPMTLEIGAGNTDAALALAQANPDQRFVAMDVYAKRYCKYNEDWKRKKLPGQQNQQENLLILSFNAQNLNLLPEASIQSIIANRPEPLGDGLMPTLARALEQGGINRVLRPDGELIILPTYFESKEVFVKMASKHSFVIADGIWKSVDLNQYSQYGGRGSHQRYVFGGLAWIYSPRGFNHKHDLEEYWYQALPIWLHRVGLDQWSVSEQDYGQSYRIVWNADYADRRDLRWDVIGSDGEEILATIKARLWTQNDLAFVANEDPLSRWFTEEYGFFDIVRRIDLMEVTPLDHEGFDEMALRNAFVDFTRNILSGHAVTVNNNAAMMDVSSLDFDWENLKVLLEKENDPKDVERFLTWIREADKQLMTLEIGAGRGETISHMASKNPSKRYVAIDALSGYGEYLKAWEERKSSEESSLPDNLVYLKIDVDVLKSLPENIFEKIFVMAPDRPLIRKIGYLLAAGYLEHVLIKDGQFGVWPLDESLLDFDTFIGRGETFKSIPLGDFGIPDVLSDFQDRNFFNVMGGRIFVMQNHKLKIVDDSLNSQDFEKRQILLLDMPGTSEVFELPDAWDELEDVQFADETSTVRFSALIDEDQSSAGEIVWKIMSEDGKRSSVAGFVKADIDEDLKQIVIREIQPQDVNQGDVFKVLIKNRFVPRILAAGWSVEEKDLAMMTRPDSGKLESYVRELLPHDQKDRAEELVREFGSYLMDERTWEFAFSMMTSNLLDAARYPLIQRVFDVLKNNENVFQKITIAASLLDRYHGVSFEKDFEEDWQDYFIRLMDLTSGVDRQDFRNLQKTILLLKNRGVTFEKNFERMLPEFKNSSLEQEDNSWLWKQWEERGSSGRVTLRQIISFVRSLRDDDSKKRHLYLRDTKFADNAVSFNPLDDDLADGRRLSFRQVGNYFYIFVMPDDPRYQDIFQMMDPNFGFQQGDPLSLMFIHLEKSGEKILNLQRQVRLTLDHHKDLALYLDDLESVALKQFMRWSNDQKALFVKSIASGHLFGEYREDTIGTYHAIHRSTVARLNRLFQSLGFHLKFDSKWSEWFWGYDLQADPAMVAEERKTGGIDLTSKMMDIQSSGQMDPAMTTLPKDFDLENFRGFVPVIYSIQPLKDLPMFLGMNGQEPAPGSPENFPTDTRETAIDIWSRTGKSS